MTQDEISDGVVESIHITQHDIDRAVEEDKPVYFPSSSHAGVVFALHAVDEDDVQQADEMYTVPDGD